MLDLACATGRAVRLSGPILTDDAHVLDRIGVALEIVLECRNTV